MPDDSQDDLDNVVIYTTDYCSFCTRARRFLNEHKIAFKEIDVGYDRSAREKMEQLSQRRTVPQIFFGARHIGGYTDLIAWHQRKESPTQPSL